MTKRPIDVEKAAQLQHAFAVEYNETGLIGLASYGAHIHPDHMTEVAPLSEWKLNAPRSFPKEGEWAFRHTVTVNGTEFYTVTYKEITP